MPLTREDFVRSEPPGMGRGLRCPVMRCLTKGFGTLQTHSLDAGGLDGQDWATALRSPLLASPAGPIHKPFHQQKERRSNTNVPNKENTRVWQFRVDEES